MPFALTPGILNLNYLDYTEKADRKVFEQATKALKQEFNRSSAQVAILQEQLIAKADDFGWSNNDTSDIIHVPVDPATPNDYRNIINESSQLTTAAITAWAMANIVNVQSRRAQNNYNMYRCLFNSISNSTQAEMALERHKYEVQDTVIAALFYKVLISKAEVDTQATIALTRSALTRLDQKMLELNSDIADFNIYVQECKKRLSDRRASADDLLINLFTGYKAAQDSDFVKTISDIEKDYLYGKTPNLTDVELMSQALVAFKVRYESQQWGTLSQEHEMLVAMQAKLDNIHDNRLKLDTSCKKVSKNGKKGSKERGKTTKTPREKKKQDDGPRWQDVNAEGKATLVRSGITYNWCKHHNQGAGMWVTHKLEDCRNRIRDEEENSPQAPTMARAAVAAIEADDSVSESSDDE